MSRNFGIPIVVAIFLSCLCVCFTIYALGRIETYYMDATTYLKGIELPSSVAMTFFLTAHVYIWIFPIMAAVLGFSILRHKECNIIYLAWYCSICLLICVILASFCSLALYRSHDNILMEGPFVSTLLSKKQHEMIRQNESVRATQKLDSGK